jgi:hypothetical protein
MKSNASNNTSSRRSRAGWVLSGAIALLLSACGGGGDAAPGAKPAINSASSQPGTSTTPAGSADGITLTLALTSGADASASLAIGKPLTVSATVLDLAGKPVANALVVFSLDTALVALTPVGAVATDASGKASVTLTPAGISRSGATRLTALAASNASTAQAAVTVTVAAPKISLNQVTPATSPAMLQAYGSSVVTLDVLSSGFLLSSLPASISLHSSCGAIDRASLPASVTTVAGRAQFTYTDKGCARADTIVASVDGDGASVNINLAAASPGATSIEVGSISPPDSSIVIQGAGGAGRSETATVGFKVLDKSGLPVANQVVTFATISTKAVRLSQSSGTTDLNGEVVTNLISGTEPTAVRVSATLANGLSTVSDTITVTTGLPIQNAFSLSATEFNIEGFNYDDVRTDIKLLLADQFGNPVADGVPVVAQTDSGAIGSAARGGCTTLNGSCTMSLRSQNPRYGDDASAPSGRAGVATIQVSTLAGTNVPLTGQIAVFFSGSVATNITLLNPPAGVSFVGGKLAASSPDCKPVVVQFRLSDVRHNPMPAKSTLLLDAAMKMSASAYPALVPSIAPRYTNGYVLGDQGSEHTVALTPDADCSPGGPIKSVGSGMLTLTTPMGNTTSIPVTLNFDAVPPTPKTP